MRGAIWRWWHRRHGQLVLRIGSPYADAGAWAAPYPGTLSCQCGAVRDR